MPFWRSQGRPQGRVVLAAQMCMPAVAPCPPLGCPAITLLLLPLFTGPHLLRAPGPAAVPLQPRGSRRKPSRCSASKLGLRRPRPGLHPTPVVSLSPGANSTARYGALGSTGGAQPNGKIFCLSDRQRRLLLAATASPAVVARGRPPPWRRRAAVAPGRRAGRAGRWG